MRRRMLSKHQISIGFLSVAAALLVVFSNPALLSAEEVAKEPATIDMAAYAKQVRPLLAKHCFECHGPDQAEGSLRLDSLAPEFATITQTRLWTKILNRIESGEMPPKDQPRLVDGDRSQITAWLNSRLLAAERSTLP